VCACNHAPFNDRTISEIKMNIQEQNDRKRKLCPHCNQFLAKSTFHQHRSLYFQNDEWMLTGKYSYYNYFNSKFTSLGLFYLKL